MCGKEVVDNRLGCVRRCHTNMTPHVGTELYAAPEVLFGGHAEDHNWYGYPSDVWSYGCIAFELLTLEMFLSGALEPEVVSSIVRRLGPFPPKAQRLGTRQDTLLAAAARFARERPQLVEKVLLLKDMESRLSICALGHLSRVLCWLPSTRSCAKSLLSDAWLAMQDTPESTGASSVASASSWGRAASQDTLVDAIGAPSPGAAALPFDWGCSHSQPHSVSMSEDDCACSGHCNVVGHRYRAQQGKRVCQNRLLVVGSSYCLSCVCSMSGCVAPRNKSDFCVSHRREMERLPWCARAVRAASHMLPTMVPCDVVSFCEAFPHIRHSFFCTLMCAWLKEPTAVKCLSGLYRDRSSRPRRADQDMFQWLREVLQTVDSADNRVEQQARRS